MSLLKRIHLKGEIKDARIKGVNNKPVSQSCAVAKSEKFWRATGQSNLEYKRLATTKASKFWFSCSHNCQWSSLPFSLSPLHSVCQVWLSSGFPELFTFSYCAWLWNWCINEFEKLRHQNRPFIANWSVPYFTERGWGLILIKYKSYSILKGGNIDALRFDMLCYCCGCCLPVAF